MENTILEKGPITDELIEKMDKYFRAANYLSAGQLYLLENPLLKKPLTNEMVKKKIVGHWGTVPGQNFIFLHANRVIKRYDLDMILLSGPGHGGNFFIANDYIDGSYSEIYPNISQDEEGMQKLFKQFSFPGGVPSHCAPETPGSIHEGGELGYSIAHACGAVFDNPELIATVVVGDGEAETGPLATSWQCNKFINPVGDGAVLPILHLNGYKIANPTIFGRLSKEELTDFFHGNGWEPYFVEGDEPKVMHKLMAETMDKVIEKIKDIQKNARENNDATRPVWPMIVLRTPKGWTGPKVVDGNRIEGNFLAHQVPIMMDKPEHLQMLSDWLHSYKPEELFDENGRVIDEIKELCPVGDKRLGMNPHANGGKLLRDLRLPDFRDYGFDIEKHGAKESQDTANLGLYIRDLFKLNAEAKNIVAILSPATQSAVEAASVGKNFAMDPFRGVKVITTNALPDIDTATENQVYAIIGDFGYGALANFPAGDSGEIKIDDKGKMKSDLVDILGREFIAVEPIANRAFVNITKPAAV